MATLFQVFSSSLQMYTGWIYFRFLLGQPTQLKHWLAICGKIWVFLEIKPELSTWERFGVITTMKCMWTFVREMNISFILRIILHTITKCKVLQEIIRYQIHTIELYCVLILKWFYKYLLISNIIYTYSNNNKKKHLGLHAVECKYAVCFLVTMLKFPWHFQKMSDFMYLSTGVINFSK